MQGPSVLLCVWLPSVSLPLLLPLQFPHHSFSLLVDDSVGCQQVTTLAMVHCVGIVVRTWMCESVHVGGGVQYGEGEGQKVD